MSQQKSIAAPAIPEKVAHREKSTNTAGEKSAPTTEPFKLLIERGVADKLNPKATGKVYFQLARHTEENRNYLRIDGNDSGGLYSREWIPLETLVEQLKAQAGHPFKSLMLKACMKGKSANNASFLAAILRSPDIQLIQPAESSLFLHQLVEDFDARSAALLKRTK